MADPQFEEKAAAIIGPYSKAPEKAVVLRVDQRLLLSPGRAEGHAF